MKIMVIGGSGFVGTRLCKRFSERPHTFFKIFDKLKSAIFSENTVIGDIVYPLNLNLFDEVDVLINLAAEHLDNVTPKSLYYDTNVIGAINVCEVARRKNISKIIFTSSVAVYGYAPLGTDENGKIAPFNEYGSTKWKAEQIYKKWQMEDPLNRTLVIVRPTVIFGEHNRGNVFKLLNQISLGKFVMIGRGLNRKSMAYVENVAAFIEYSLNFKTGIHIYNYTDKPDLTMNQLVDHINKLLGGPLKRRIRLPYFLGIFIGKIFDAIAFVFKKKFSISTIRIKKFCTNSVYESAVEKTGFSPPFSLVEGIEKTVMHEFFDHH